MWRVGSDGDASRMSSYRSLIASASLAAVGLVPTPALAASPSTLTAAPAIVAGSPALATCTSATSADLAGFFDSTLPARLQQDYVPGAVVSVVNHDSQLFAKGYGL